MPDSLLPLGRFFKPTLKLLRLSVVSEAIRIAPDILTWCARRGRICEEEPTKTCGVIPPSERRNSSRHCPDGRVKSSRHGL